MLWTKATITHRIEWSEILFSLQFSADIHPFKAGQFATIGMDINDKRINRAYSFVNSPQQSELEIYAICVLGGALSPRLHKLNIGDSFWINRKANGFFTLDEVPSSETLWMLASGTGIGPFLSILGTSDLWVKFDKAVLIHSVRYEKDLSYKDQLNALVCKHTPRFTVIPFVSREHVSHTIFGRVPEAIKNGLLEHYVGDSILPKRSHVMVCGNPFMILETVSALEHKGLRKNRRRSPGQITVEQYWNK